MDKDKYIKMALPYRLNIYNDYELDTITLELRWEDKGVGREVSKQHQMLSKIDVIAYEINDMKRELDRMIN